MARKGHVIVVFLSRGGMYVSHRGKEDAVYTYVYAASFFSKTVELLAPIGVIFPQLVCFYLQHAIIDFERAGQYSKIENSYRRKVNNRLQLREAEHWSTAQTHTVYINASVPNY